MEVAKTRIKIIAGQVAEKDRAASREERGGSRGIAAGLMGLVKRSYAVQAGRHLSISKRYSAVEKAWNV